MKNIFRLRINSLSLLITLLTIVLTNQYILAQESIDMSNIKFEIVCEDTVGVKDLVHIGYVLDYGDQFKPDFLELKIPKFETDCAKLLYVGKTGTSTSFNMIRGKQTTTHKVKWDATIRTTKEGKFTTPDVTLIYKNDTLDVFPNSKTIIIVEPTKLSNNSDTDNDTVIKIPDNAIIRLVTVLDKNSINLGDSVSMQIKFQSDQSFSEVKFETPLEIDDCFYQNLETFTNQPVQTTIDGVECNEWIISEYLLTPLKSGVIKIPEIRIKGNCSIRKDQPDSFWGSLPKYYNIPFQAHSKEIKLKVK